MILIATCLALNLTSRAWTQENGRGCGDADQGCETAGCDGFCDDLCPEPWIVSRDALCDFGCLDGMTETFAGIGHGEHFQMPISGGAWHWFHQSLIGRSGGYGIPGLRDTYFWYLYADPQYAVSDHRKVGGHLELRLRENGTFRTFIDQQIWTWESYIYLQDDDLGTFKAGQLFNRFGLFWNGVFFGNAAYFDGLKLDADYGLSWEKTTEVHDCLRLNTYLQYFFHEDQGNGSFAGADAESVAGYSEKNTGVLRVEPTWTLSDGSQLTWAASVMVGEIDSQIALPDETVWAYGTDLTYARGAWKSYLEVSQLHGVRHPVNYISGGPSDELTNLLSGVQYTQGPVTYQASYSNSIYDNPGAIQNMILAGITISLTDHVDLYVEWNQQRIDDAELPGQNGYLFNALEWAINWHF
jgi:hypothetical protein